MPERETSGKFYPAFFRRIVKLNEEFPKGEIPLHITLFPPLQVPYDEAIHGKAIRDSVNPITPFSVKVGEGDMFSDDNGELTIPVKRIEYSPDLYRVHIGLVLAIRHLTHDPTYRKPYNPHMSQSNTESMSQGEEIDIAGFSIVGKKDGGLWTVVDKIGLKGLKNETAS